MNYSARAALATAGALVLIGGMSALGAPAQAHPRLGDLPPQCVTVRIENPSGALWWSRWCGTGAAGESPMRPGVQGNGPLVVDGAYLRPAGCGSFANPCVILWPKSPRT